MAFPREYVSYGVVKLNKFSGYNGVSVYKGLYDYTSLAGFSGSASAEDCRWSGDCIIVKMRDGEIRRYRDFSNFDRI
jgi:hypothetical protein